MITVFVTWDGDEDALQRTVESLKGQDAQFQKEVHLRTLKWNGSVSQSLREQMKTVRTPLVTVIAAGERYLGNALEAGCRYLLQEQHRTDAVILPNVSRRVSASGSGTCEGRLYDLDKAGDLLKLPGCMRGIIYRTDALQDEDFTCGTEACFGETLACRVLLRKRTVGVVKNAYFSGYAAISDVDEMREEWENADWYLDVVEKYCLPMLLDYRQEDGRIPLFLQAQVLFALKAAFRVNMDHKNKGVLKGERLEHYLELCTRCLQMISNRLISTAESTHSERRFVYAHWSALMCLKYQSVSDQLYIGEGQLLCSCESVDQEKGFVPFVTVDLMEYENGVWRMDGSIERFLTEEPLCFGVLINQVPATIRYIQRFSRVSFFGKAIVEKAAFAVEIAAESLADDSEITFVLTDRKKNRLVLPVAAVDYQSRLTSLLKQSYWCFNRSYMVQLKRSDAGISGILIRKTGRAARMRQELRLLKEILRASYGSKQMFLVRCLYWLVYPVYSGKNIWITFDKLYKGGDCGEYFYKYMVSRKKDGIVPGYVIRSDAPDYQRLVQEGYRPLAYRSLRQRLSYLYAVMVFGTHSSVHSFCGFSKWEIRFVQDRLRAVNTCIQHGLSVQDLTFDSNRIVNNNKRYYCASGFEVENLSKPAYDYAPEVLKLTGIPRYDGLVNRDQKQILITPTWRAYIAMPAVMGSARPYNPEFRNTDYYKIFQELLENRKLVETAKRTGYRIVYLLHPIIGAQKEDFRPGEGIDLVSALDISYEQILTQSSLMVTDYSGVQFDFAYMRKPVVYFHPPKLPPHYEDGGFFYDTQGFGEICTQTEELVHVLCEYMESGCRLKDFYRARQDDFFAYDDHENCRRIYEDAKQYLEERTCSV